MKKEKTDWGRVIIRAIVEYVFAVAFLAIGWNILLPLIFNFVPKLGFGKLCFLALAMDFILMPVTISASVTRGKILSILQGEEE